MGSASDALSAAAPFVAGGMLWSDAGGGAGVGLGGWGVTAVDVVDPKTKLVQRKAPGNKWKLNDGCGLVWGLG